MGQRKRQRLSISIHTLLAESDPAAQGIGRGAYHFYPHSPCGERRGPRPAAVPRQDFYPHSPCGERHSASFSNGVFCTISIHTLLAESDVEIYALKKVGMEFLSTLSLRRATCAAAALGLELQISIHTLLAESDALPRLPMAAQPQFLSTLSLRRATPFVTRAPAVLKIFLSTLSLRRATLRCTNF